MLDKLKIGILDLLTILVPGGFLVFILSDKLVDFANHTWKGYPLMSSQWITIGISFALAYILGHFIFLVASFLDDLLYEKVRKVYWHDHAKLISYTVMIKEKKTGPLQRKVLSAWKWACAWLMTHQPAIYAEVERYMAESKFFRSLIIVCIIGFFVFPAEQKSWGMIVGLLVLIFLSLIRYLTQRQKSLETAYHGIITTAGEVLPAQPDPHIFADVKKEYLYPNVYWHQQVEKNNNKPGRRLRPDKLWYGILKFLYTLGLCLIPGFSLLLRGKQARKLVREQKQAANQLAMERKRNEEDSKAMAQRKIMQESHAK